MLAIPFLFACSLKDLDYLKEGAPDASEGGAGTGGGNGSGGGFADADADGGAGGAAGQSSSQDAGGADVVSDGSSLEPAADAGDSLVEADLGRDALADALADSSSDVASDGASEDGSSPADATRDVNPDAALGPELLANPSFEDDWNAAGWSFDPTTALTTAVDGSTYTLARVEEPKTSDPAAPDGIRKLTSWNDKVTYTIDVYQKLTGLSDGTYVFSGYFQSGAAGSILTAYIYVKSCGGPDRQVAIPASDSNYISVKIEDIAVSGGSCQVGYHADQGPGSWVGSDLYSFRRLLE